MIPPGHIHAWFFSIDPGACGDCDWHAFLSPEERVRAASFRFDRDRNRFLAAHGILRRILDSYLPQPARLVYGANGKPALACGRLHFNLSHADDRALIAVSATVPLGVDLERVRPEPDAARIAEYCFSPTERSALSLLPPARQAEAFFQCWTRKEAFVKALGDGLSYPLTGFSVSLDEAEDETLGEPARILDLAGDAHAAAQWSVHPLVPEPGYVGAIVARRPSFPVPLQVIWRNLTQLTPAPNRAPATRIEPQLISHV
ncbi:MAG TPA: 4'-phosphopantetheinyl transferase superfamily protein [Granulicella sp.]|jgi:4'-phosphopantetheinyl transferase|nr:4'-phosphopantetheinyl transferase superfamily protein [Granulicella sp.]